MAEGLPRGTDRGKATSKNLVGYLVSLRATAVYTRNLCSHGLLRIPPVEAMSKAAGGGESASKGRRWKSILRPHVESTSLEIPTPRHLHENLELGR